MPLSRTFIFSPSGQQSSVSLCVAILGCKMVAVAEASSTVVPGRGSDLAVDALVVATAARLGGGHVVTQMTPMTSRR